MEQNGERVTDTVTYSQDTTVEVPERTAGRVNMTVTRTASKGRVVVTHVSEETFESAEDVRVRVDGEAATSASSYAELRQATEGGDTSRYMVRQTSSASAEADATVLVGINHFSSRDVSMTDGSSESDSGGDSAGDSTDGDPSTGGDSSDGDSSDGDASDDDASDGDSGGDAANTATGNGPGFGLVAAVVALTASVAVALARRRRG